MTPLIDFSGNTGMNSDKASRVSRLGVIHVTGTDATSFLRAQLTKDITRLEPGEHALAAWCDAKGQTQLILRMATAIEGYYLLLPHDVIAAALKRLRLYVLRADVKLNDISDSYNVSGLLGTEEAPDTGAAVWRDDQLWLGLPGSVEHQKRALIIHRAELPPPSGAIPTDADQWQLSEINAGIPRITTAIQGQYQPQMLNLHWLSAIDFDKGCYPGQEVIARLQFRGNLPRRTYRLGWNGGKVNTNDSILDSNNNKLGTIIQASNEYECGHALAILKISAGNEAVLQTDQGVTVSLLDLPYATTES